MGGTGAGRKARNMQGFCCVAESVPERGQWSYGVEEELSKSNEPFSSVP